MNLIHVNTTGEWACKSIQPSGEYNGTTLNTAPIDCGMHDLPWKMNSYNTIVSPQKYSFACHKMVFSNENFTVKFESLQVFSSYHFLIISF